MINNLRLLYLKLTNQFYGIYNKLKLSLSGVKYGKHCIIHGPISISLAQDALVCIGDNFCFLSGRSLNPLSRNLQGCICANRNAFLKIGNYVNMSSTCIRVHESITIGNYVNIGANVILMDSDAHSLNFLDRRNPKKDIGNKKNSPIVVEDDVLIGVNSIILKGVTIGARSIIGAGSVVTKSVPPDCIACGNPARVVRMLNTD